MITFCFIYVFHSMPTSLGSRLYKRLCTVTSCDKRKWWQHHLIGVRFGIIYLKSNKWRTNFKSFFLSCQQSTPQSHSFFFGLVWFFCITFFTHSQSCETTAFIRNKLKNEKSVLSMLAVWKRIIYLCSIFTMSLFPSLTFTFVLGLLSLVCVPSSH